MKRYWLFWLCLWVVWGCVKPPEYPVEPVIEYKSLSDLDILQTADTSVLEFGFTDGDGDIGLQDDEVGFDIFLTDSRTGFVEKYRLPHIKPQGATRGISGTVRIRLLATCCIPTTRPACEMNPNQVPDTLSYAVLIKDLAGHLSNVVETQRIILRCH
jgi:hypothetical protein